MPNDKDDLDMKVLTTLGQFEREHGEAAHNALLKRFGATSAMDLKPKDYERVIAECAAFDGDNDEGGEDDAPHRRQDRTKSNARTPLPMETVINGAADIKSGFDLAAKAIHAKRPKS